MPQTTERPLGATFSDGLTTFRVRSEPAERVDLCLIDSSHGRHHAREQRVPMRRGLDGVWEASAPVAPGARYGYRVHGRHDPARGLRVNPAKLLADPYSRQIDTPKWDAAALELLRDSTPGGEPDPRDNLAVAPWSVVCAPRAAVPSSRPALPPGGRVIYEAHLAHLTARLPDIAPEARGTFGGLRSPHLIKHLTDMGITTLELLPVMHWADELGLRQRGMRNVWGYNPLGYFSPMPLYCASADIDAQWDEVASAVGDLHEAGIEVILDVVYNHTCEGASNDPTYHLRGLDNLGYYRTRHDDPSTYLDVTGCGSTLDAGSELVQDLVVDSLRHWVQMSDVDGFRFDLATTLGRAPEFSADHPLLRRISADPVLGERLLIAEPWDVGHGGYQVGRFTTHTRGEPWAEWNDRFRSSVRDYWRPGHGSRADLTTAIAGSQLLFGERPSSSSIGFVTAHDGFTLRDLVSYDRKHNSPNGEHGADGSNDNQSWNGGVEGETDDPDIQAIRLRRQASILTCLMLQIGTPMITAGDERDRTQRGNNNPYCLDDDDLAVPWGPSPNADYLTSLMQQLAAVRREHAPLFDGQWLVAPGETGGHVVRWLGRDGQQLTTESWREHDKVLGVHYPPSEGRGPLFIVVNGTGEDAAVVLPSGVGDGGWRIGIDTADPARTGTALTEGESLSLKPFSTVVLAD